jgi:hypothetical protein
MTRHLRRLPVSRALAFAALLLLSRNALAQEYTSQTYVDTSIQRAFYNLNAATDVAGMGMKMEEAIAFARQTANRLKSIAKGNPNEKYILWKVGELESQVYLEENGLLLEKNQKRQRQVNDLVGPFNTEIGKHRPDFSHLAEMYNQALTIDRSKAFEFGTALESRKRGIRREAVASLESGVATGDFDLAWRELVYLKNNMAPLGIPLAQYSMLAAEVQAKVKVDNEREFIATNANAVESEIAKNSFAEARTSLGVLDDRVESLRDIMRKVEWDRCYFRNKHLRETLDRREDSLIRVNTVILRDQGVVAADDYLENTVKKSGVFHEKVGRMELAILEKAMASRKLQDTSVVKQLASISMSQADDSSSVFSDLMSAAKKRAQEKADSAAAAQEGHGHVTHIEGVRLANMRVSQELLRKREDELQKENVDRAEKQMIDIYVLLEKKEVQKAHDQYTDHQALLARYIPAQAFSVLDSTVNARYAATGKRKK